MALADSGRCPKAQVMKEFKSGCVHEDIFFKQDIAAVQKAAAP